MSLWGAEPAAPPMGLRPPPLRGRQELSRLWPLSWQPEVKHSISLFMSYVHTTVNEMSKVYLATERRYNYTTPKTFLEQIKLYQNLLYKKQLELVAKIERLENGLMKLQSTASQVGPGGSPFPAPLPSLSQKAPGPLWMRARLGWLGIGGEDRGEEKMRILGNWHH